MRTKYKHRRVAIVPAARRAAANAALERLGWGPDNFSRALYPPAASSHAPATHYAADIALTPRMLEQLQGALPPGGRIEDVGPLGQARRLERAAAAVGAQSHKPD